MAKRYSGNLTITVVYHDDVTYKCTVSGPGGRWSGVIRPAPFGFGAGVSYDSAKAYTEMARTALSFANHEAGDGTGYICGGYADSDDREYTVSSRKPR